MFIQVFQGKVADEARLRAAMERWMRDCRPGAIGWLGATWGFTDDGMFLCVVRFESEEAARQTSDRPEQSAWWEEAATCFDGEVTFINSADVSTWLAGGDDTAKFVQIIEGHFTDPERMRSLMDEYSDQMHEMRPEIIGATVALQEDGGYVETVYFTSEEEARERESVAPPEEVADEMASQMQDARFFDLHRPMMMSAN